ncbi:hypothetical protein [Cytobacillus praedii]|uniref:Uncharacterized protein n=1 Tax=Cytobacillus praedii TaxID=1742358 RepID=A0A4R1B030_9BACI|nr:hypothetical protein [Cytobacillus praedii]TCJ03332.1 hypothetical protein E0Y62_14645 [Cytobacillus praedii]
MEILCSKNEFHYINDIALATLNDVRRKYFLNRITADQRCIWVDKADSIFETYTGTKITKTLVWMLRHFRVDTNIRDGVGRITIVNPKASFQFFKK